MIAKMGTVLKRYSMNDENLKNKQNKTELHVVLGVSGGIGNAAQVPLFWIVMTGKYYIIDHTLFWMALMFGFISGVVITGLLGKLITNKIEKSEILHS